MDVDAGQRERRRSIVAADVSVDVDASADVVQSPASPPAPATTPTGATMTVGGLALPSPKKITDAGLRIGEIAKPALANQAERKPEENGPPPGPGADAKASIGPTPEKKITAERAAGLRRKIEELTGHLSETYRDKPVEFIQDVLLANKPGFELDEWQKELLRAIARGERRISVRAGHGVGKTACLAMACIWFMLTRYPQKTQVTAPTASQLFDALFSEIKTWINELPPILRGTIEAKSDRIVLVADPDGSFISAKTSSADKPEALQGVHSAHVLLIADEASGVPEAVFEAAVGSMSGYNATTVLLGNPTRNSGLFFKTHHGLKQDWFRLHVSCLDCKRVSPDFVEQVKNTYGEASNAYRVRVLGEFALREDDVLIPADLVDSAMVRDIVLDGKEPIVYGVDVARFGDDRTILLKRQGSVVLEYKRWQGADLMETTGRVAFEANKDKPAEILVDSIGLGSGVADRLRELKYNVRDVNVSESSALNPQAARLRDELWLAVKDWLGTRACRLPKDEDLRQELCSPTYTFLSNGKVKVESKQDMKKRGLRSPDIADALCLTFAGTAAFVGGRASRWVTGKPLKRNVKGVV